MNNRIEAIRFGANYIPSKNWLYSWLDWDRSSILADLQAIASLGMDHIRAHLLWPFVQPNEKWVSGTALDRLEDLLDMCDVYNLDVEVTVLSGWMSGTAFYPSWKKDANMFTDRRIIQAEKFLFGSLANRIAKHPRFLGFDLGNELSVHYYINDPISIIEGDAWLREIMGFCDEVAPGKFHVNGVDHIPWFADTAFSRTALSETGSATSLHTWIQFSGAMDLYKPNSIGCTGLAEYCIELAHAYSGNQSRKIWIEEFGSGINWIPVEQIPDFTEATIRRAVSCRNVWGFTWWCSHDIDRKFGGFDEMEYDLGLFTVKNDPKPVAQRIAQLIREFKFTPPQPIERTVALILPDNLLAQADPSPYSKDKIGWKFAKPYLDLLQEGWRHAIVLQSRALDQKHLRSRGINEVRSV